MHLVPVLDLQHGCVVHARGGERRRYRPVSSRLSRDAHPEAVVEALLALYPFDTVYLADLDALAGGGDHAGIVERLLERFPALELWIDSGLAPAYDGLRRAQRTRLVDVHGTETPAAIAALGALAPARRRRAILSLDFRGGRMLGEAPHLERDPASPRRVIVMNLDRVGSGAGPDRRRLAALCRRWPEHRIYAAGGVRDLADVRALGASGAAGALIASALHDGRLDAGALRAAGPRRAAGPPGG